MTTTNTQLTGDALIAKFNEMTEAGVSKTDMVKACGYIKDDGKIGYTDFYENLLTARGVVLNYEPEVDDEPDENAGDCTYLVSVPVYVNVMVSGKPGLSDKEVIELAKKDYSFDDDDYLMGKIDEVLYGWVKPAAPVEVEEL